MWKRWIEDTVNSKNPNKGHYTRAQTSPNATVVQP